MLDKAQIKSSFISGISPRSIAVVVGFESRVVSPLMVVSTRNRSVNRTHDLRHETHDSAMLSNYGGTFESDGAVL